MRVRSLLIWIPATRTLVTPWFFFGKERDAIKKSFLFISSSMKYIMDIVGLSHAKQIDVPGVSFRFMNYFFIYSEKKSSQ
jgi:hypothetical protein